MKKSFALFCGLLLAALVGVGVVSAGAMASAEQVTFFENKALQAALKREPQLRWSPAAGPQAIQDLRLELGILSRERLHWQIELSPAIDPAKGQTDFALRPYDQQLEAFGSHNRIELRFNGSFGASVSGGVFELGNEGNAFGLDKMLADVASRAPNNGTYTETVDLRDYYTSWPLTVDLDFPGAWMNWDEIVAIRQQLENGQDDTTAPRKGAYLLANALLKAFRFPITGHPRMEVELQMAQGGVVGIHANMVEMNEAGPAVWSFGACTNTACYFVVDAREADGSLMDYSSTLGGYGLYRLPLYKEGDVPRPEDLKFVCPLSIKERVRLMFANEDGTRLLLVVEDETGQRLHVFDDAGNLVQRLPIPGAEKDQWGRFYTAPGLLLAVQAHMGDKGLSEPKAQPSFILFDQDEQGNYRQQMADALPADKDFELLYQGGRYGNAPAIAYDGRRLALAESYGTGYGGDCGYALLVYDEDGLLYADARQSSLASGDTRVQTQENCKVEPGSVRVRFGPAPAG